MLNRFASIFPESKAARSSGVSAHDSASSRAVQLGFIIPPHHCVLVRGGVVAWNQHLWRLITPTLRLGLLEAAQARIDVLERANHDLEERLKKIAALAGDVAYSPKNETTEPQPPHP